MWYNNEVGSTGTASWKLNNAKKKVTTLEISKTESQEKTKKLRSNNASVIEQDFKEPEGFWYTTYIKSLILAQDERWRHA